MLTSKHEIILTDLKGGNGDFTKAVGDFNTSTFTVVRIVKLVNKQLHKETDT